MPVVLKKYGNKFCAVERGAKGKPIAARCHMNKADAVKQVQAMNISMAKAGKFGAKAKAAVSKVKKK